MSDKNKATSIGFKDVRHLTEKLIFYTRPGQFLSVMSDCPTHIAKSEYQLKYQSFYTLIPLHF